MNGTNELAVRLRTYRSENDLNQAETGEKLGVRHAVFASWEHGEFPSSKYHDKIAQLLGLENSAEVLRLYREKLPTLTPKHMPATEADPILTALTELPGQVVIKVIEPLFSVRSNPHVALSGALENVEHLIKQAATRFKANAVIGLTITPLVMSEGFVVFASGAIVVLVGDTSIEALESRLMKDVTNNLRVPGTGPSRVAGEIRKTMADIFRFNFSSRTDPQYVALMYRFLDAADRMDGSETLPSQLKK